MVTVDLGGTEYYDKCFFYTPTYIIAAVAAGFLLVSLALERGLHLLGKVL